MIHQLWRHGVCTLAVSADDLPSGKHIYFLLAGMLLITMYLLMRLRKRHRRSAQDPGPLERVERVRQMRGMRGDLEDLMVEIEQLAKRFGAQLDAKSLQLERLLDEADQRIAQLQTLGREHPGASGQHPRAEPPPDPMTQRVYDLADQGMEPSDIAGKLNEHIGKVELILALRSA